jgi:hypothetical protein
LALKHWRALPSLSGGGELGIIHREVNKKRRHMPIRKLMAQAGRAVQSTKPVFMTLEAKAVAEAVMAHARTHPDLTLGVVAFSVAQRDAIEQQLELLRQQDASCEPFFAEGTSEPFFIKNLENVQGDERDFIFISVGYGRTAEGYLPMSFGPLNREGGERRLNVLISRARQAMDVFSNFKASDVDLDRTKARGVAALRNFLAYAETGVLEQPHSTGGEPDSDFEEAVIDALSKRGVELEPRVGTAGFFIDIAVKDPENPGSYLLGIACDGTETRRKPHPGGGEQGTAAEQTACRHLDPK